MSLLLMVRHGQASFLTDNYDRLSDLGRQQMRLLGEYWCDRDLRLDAVYSGTLQRQIDSAGIVCEVYRERGKPCPDPVRIPELNEYQAEEFLFNHLDHLREIDPLLNDQFEDFESSADPKQRSRNYQKMFETAMRHWLTGRVRSGTVESWESFTQRVERGLAEMTQPGRSGRHVAAFASGGTISAVVRHALGTDPETTLQLSWMLRNASLTTFLFSRDRFTLSSFNETPHLRDREHWTYR